MRNMFLAVVIGVGAVGISWAVAPAWIAKTAPKPIETIMKEAMSNPLGKRVSGGTASDEDKAKFLDYMIDLVENDPPQGDAMEWKMAAGHIMVNAAKVVVGRENAAEELKESMNCKTCHDVFRPKKQK